MTPSTELTHRRAQGDPEFMVRQAHHGEGNRTVEWVRVMVLRPFDRLMAPRKIEGVPQDGEENRSVRKIEP
jgi:hypothetical protein